MNESISINDYAYNLPDERIAKFPVEPRDSSKLLTYKNGEISETLFTDLTNQLPEGAFLVFNNTKVIPARLHFQKVTGAIIEVFLLNPVSPSAVISQVMETTETCTWHCMIGNKKRWKGEVLQAKVFVENQEIVLTAELVGDAEVQFCWGGVSFATLVKAFGEMPLPPYMNRKAEAKDLETYQTVYSKHDGAVAAPTAGLHFTDNVLSDLENKGFKSDFVTLHVGAGTFQPVKVDNALEHDMHEEQVVFSVDFIKNLRENSGCVIPVGTTSMRSLESLYWYGVKLLTRENDKEQTPFYIEQNYAYKHVENELPTLEISLRAIISYMEEEKLTHLIGGTQIYIFPGYTMRVCKGIITNFHQPKSTLLLLISALVGDNWQKIYDYALENDFRFLSYGDSSLLLGK
ncbi:MAG: S-adenosylmethionine:tRNA ribosyltransferase-isomerase [Spirosomaceae bacterium]|nr:S-adenosylmethionine:tRNA ribosyltransferase-isomerase [Spirosomataceae bacterium]